MWQVLYTKRHAEAWAEINLRKQGFVTLLPYVRQGSALTPLFPRYIFSGYHPGQPSISLGNTSGVLYVVSCGEQPARVPLDVIEQIRSRMDAHGVVELEKVPSVDPLFAKAERQRLRALETLVATGFRVKVG
jgi:transcriptional antiterminator RfaH